MKKVVAYWLLVPVACAIGLFCAGWTIPNHHAHPQLPGARRDFVQSHNCHFEFHASAIQYEWNSPDKTREQDFYACKGILADVTVPTQ